MRFNEAKRYLANSLPRKGFDDVYDRILSGVLRTILVTEVDGNGKTLHHNYSEVDFSRNAIKKLRGLIHDFSKIVGKEVILSHNPEYLGHDFWRLFAGHKLWDGLHSEEHERLLESAVKQLRRKNNIVIQVSDDGRLEIFNA